MSTAEATVELVEQANPQAGDAPALPGNFEVVEGTVSGTALAPLSQMQASLVALTEKYANKTYDIQTKAGMAEAKADRLAVREVRYRIPDIAKECKAQLRDAISKVDEFAKALTDRLLAIEATSHDAITAEEARKEKARIEAARLRAEKLAAAAETVEAIRNRVTMAVGKAPTEVEELIAVLKTIEPDAETFGEGAGDVMRAKTETLAKLQEMHTSALAWMKQQEEQREAARKAALQTEIDKFGKAILAAIGKTSQQMTEVLDSLKAVQCTPEVFAERVADAQAAQDQAVAQLQGLIAAAQVAEQAAAEPAAAKAKQAELDAQAAAQAAREQAQADEEQRQRDVAAAQAAETARQQAEAARQADEATKLAEQRAAQITTAIQQMLELPDSYTAEMSVEAIRTGTERLRAQPVTVAAFGGKIGLARTTHAAALARMEALLAGAVERDQALAEQQTRVAAPPPVAAPATAPTPAVAIAPAVDAAPLIGGQHAAQFTNQLYACVRDLLQITRDSVGVIGYRDDDGMTDWDEFEEVTRAEHLLDQCDGVTAPGA
jgi:hypothetical protein